MSNDRSHERAVADLHGLIGTREPKRTRIPSLLGNGNGVIAVTDRPYYSWVRLYGNATSPKQAFNNTVVGADGDAIEVEEIRGPQGAVGYVVLGLSPVFASAGGGGTGTWWLTVAEVSGGVSVNPVTGIKVTDGTLTNDGGGIVTLAVAPASTSHTHNFETSAGTINGSNTVFTLTGSPSPAGSLLLFRNGILQQASGNDFSLSGATITFVLAATPQTGDVLYATFET